MDNNDLGVLVIATLATSTLVSGIVDPYTMWKHLPTGAIATAVYISVYTDPAIVKNFYQNFFRIAWNSLL